MRLIGANFHQLIKQGKRIVSMETGTVEDWLRKYGREELLPKIIRIETVKERNELKELRKRVNKLETALADAHIDCSLETRFWRLPVNEWGPAWRTLKKERIDAVGRAKDAVSTVRISIKILCQKVGMSRQNYYKAHKRRQRKAVDEGLIENLVRSERAVQPRLGGRKLFSLLKDEIKAAGVSIGRDRFFEVLRKNKLLLKPLPKKPRTTNSRHSLPIFINSIKELKIINPNQVWVSDITYIRTDEGFVYLSLITDKYSRKIVGYHAGDTLETEGCLRALEKALEHKRTMFIPFIIQTEAASTARICMWEN